MSHHFFARIADKKCISSNRPSGVKLLQAGDGAIQAWADMKRLILQIQVAWLILNHREQSKQTTPRSLLMLKAADKICETEIVAN